MDVAALGLGLDALQHEDPQIGRTNLPMSATRNGKIARLPLVIRERLNDRLRNGEQGKKLVEWLNGLPEVRVMVSAEFDGKPIREQNLSEWKKRGYREWLAHQEAIEVAKKLAEQGVNSNLNSGVPLTDTLALWLASRYAVATRRVMESKGAESWRFLREMWDQRGANRKLRANHLSGCAHGIGAGLNASSS